MFWSPVTLFTTIFLCLLGSRPCPAAIVWDGPIINFAKAAFADWTQPQNQDQITPLVALTRANSQGLFNIESESFYTHNVSPAGTEWAYGTTDDFASLTFRTWELWNGGNPPSMVGRNAVLHLIQEDIYIDIKFTSWAASFGGGAFSYQRSTIPEPAGFALLGAGAFLLSLRRRR